MTRHSRRALLFPLLLLTGIIVVAGLWLQALRRQEALNRQLIVEMMKRDYKQAGVLVQAGADPNTLFKPPSAPSLQHLGNFLFHRAVMEPEKPNAFLIVCGAFWRDDNGNGRESGPDDPALVETMLQHNAHINEKDADGWTPLIWATINGLPKTVSVLLKHGANINSKDEFGQSPLLFAASEGEPDIVSLLLEHNPDINAQDSDGNTPLNLVVHKSMIFDDRNAATVIVGQLLAHGADPNLPDWKGITPLQNAHKTNRSDLIALLKQAGAKE